MNPPSIKTHSFPIPQITMSTNNWLVAIDDSIWAVYAFNYAVYHFQKGQDRLYLMHVAEDKSPLFQGDDEDFLEMVERRCKKILTTFALKAHKLEIPVTLVKGIGNNFGEVLTDAVREYGIHQLVMGRRSLWSIQRLFVGSTSRYCLEHAECNVVVVKLPFGKEEQEEMWVAKIRTMDSSMVREEGPADTKSKEKGKFKVYKFSERGY